MQMSQLSDRSGLPVATIKFYLREGLLPPGERTSRTRATYDDTHLTRLRLVRALLDVGGLSVASTKAVITAMDSGELTSDEIVVRALAALDSQPSGRTDEEYRAARADIDRLIATLGWQVDPAAQAIDALAEALTVLRATYPELPAERLLPHAHAAHDLAMAEFATRTGEPGLEAELEWAVIGTVVFERVLTAWRRLAHVDIARHELDSATIE